MKLNEQALEAAYDAADKYADESGVKRPGAIIIHVAISAYEQARAPVAEDGLVEQFEKLLTGGYHYISTAKDAPPYQSCRSCGWTWPVADGPVHEPNCEAKRALDNLRAASSALRGKTDMCIPIRIATETNWDSYGGAPTTEAAIKTAKAISVVPLHNGGIQVEVHLRGSDMEFAIGPDGEVFSSCFEVNLPAATTEERSAGRPEHLHPTGRKP